MSLTAVTGFLIFWSVSLAGYRAGRLLKIPAPAILGPIAGFLILTFGGIRPAIPGWQKPLLSVVTGILLGMRFNQKQKGVVRLMLLAAVWIVALSLLAMGALVLLGVEKETALFAATPGGMAEITLLSLSYHSDPFATVLLQSSRMIGSMVVFSTLASKYRGKEERGGEEEQPAGRPENGGNDKAGNSGSEDRERKGRRLRWYEWAILFLPAWGAAWLLGCFSVPAANLLGPMLVVGTAVKAGNITCRIDRRVQILVQTGIGGLAGASITRESVLGFPHYLLPVLVLNVLVIAGSLMLARILMKLTQWNKATCILACCPAGLSPTIMVAMEYGADVGIVTLFQVLRMVTVLISTPFAAGLILL